MTRNRLIFTLLSAAVVAVPVLAQQAAKQTPPPPAPVRPFQFPKYETKKLANGLTVFVVEDHRMPVISFRMQITTAGGSAVAANKAGLASMAAELLRQGTATRSAQDIALAVDRVGARLATSASADVASISATAMKAAAPAVLEIMADVLQNPAFAQPEIDRLMRQTLSGLQVQYNDPQALAGYLAARVAYGNHPYGMPVEGTPDTLRGLKRDDIVEFYKTHYGPAAAYLAIAGDITPAEAFAAAEKHFGNWKSSVTPRKLAAPAAPGVRPVVLLDKPDAVQTQFRLVQLAIPRNHPDFIPLMIANQIFGGSFNSRLNMKLRASEGLTYGAGSNFSTNVHAGTFGMGSFTRTDKTGTAVKMMSDLASELLTSPITDAELNEAKAYLAGSFVIGIETADAVAGRILTSAVYGLPADYWQNYREAILATTKEQVVAALKRHVTPDKLGIVAVGNAKEFAKELEGYGKVQIVPAADFDLTQPNYMRAKEAAPATAEAKGRGSELAKQAIDAMGGQAALAGIKTLRAKGSMTLSMGGQSMKADLDEVIQYPDKFRMSMTLPMGQMVQAFDGKTGWMQQGPTTRELPPAATKEMMAVVTRAAGIGILLQAASGKADMAATEPGSFDGKTLPAAIWTEGDANVKLFFDPESKRISRMSYRGMAMGGPADIEVTLADYRKVGDVYLPFQMTVYQNGQKFAERTISEYVLNENVPADSFNKPAA